jgi:hypothetical protein
VDKSVLSSGCNKSLSNLKNTGRSWRAFLINIYYFILSVGVGLPVILQCELSCVELKRNRCSQLCLRLLNVLALGSLVKILIWIDAIRNSLNDSSHLVDMP